jgi:hypothetical protein
LGVAEHKQNYILNYGSEKPLPTLLRKEPLWFRELLVPPPQRGRKQVNAVQEGCMLDLKPAHDEN